MTLEKNLSEPFYMGNGKYWAWQCQDCGRDFEILDKRPAPSFCPYCGNEDE